MESGEELLAFVIFERRVELVYGISVRAIIE